MVEVLETIRYRGIRKTIGQRMEVSRTIPHHLQGKYVDVTDLLAIREKINAEREGVHLSINDFMVRACSPALQRTPIMNSALIDNQIVVYKSLNIGVIAAIDKGLIAPVIKESQDKDIYEISNECRELVEKARNGTLMPDEYSEGTFTITNIGPLKAEDSVPLLFPPQCGILAVCATRRLPVVMWNENGEEVIVPRSMCKLVIASDHRITDGVPLAAFLNNMKELLEHPEQLV